MLFIQVLSLLIRKLSQRLCEVDKIYTFPVMPPCVCVWFQTKLLVRVVSFVSLR